MKSWVYKFIFFHPKRIFSNLLMSAMKTLLLFEKCSWKYSISSPWSIVAPFCFILNTCKNWLIHKTIFFSSENSECFTFYKTRHLFHRHFEDQFKQFWLFIDQIFWITTSFNVRIHYIALIKIIKMLLAIGINQYRFM